MRGSTVWDDIQRFMTGEDVTVMMVVGTLIGMPLLLTAWASAASPGFRWTCGLTAGAILVTTAASQPAGWINIGASLVTLAVLVAAVIAIDSHDNDHDNLASITWRGGFFTRPQRAPREERKQARKARLARTSRLATALGVEIALLRIDAGLDRLTIADRLGIPVGRYGDIEDATEGGHCVSVADLEAIATLHNTNYTAIYEAALNRIARNDLPTRNERALRALELALGTATDRYFTDRAIAASPGIADGT
ncbi:hypothetical protein [Nocardia sp. NPDC047038]|uniref:hypothetical protein n=1 Tax=Nocardia sp. NPDC047038 TaxID=3154338 RepID=UPI0033F96D76